VSVGADRSIAFGRLTSAVHICRLDTKTNAAEIVPAKVTNSAGFDVRPATSPNGRWLVFGRREGQFRDIWARDLQSGVESLFFKSASDKTSAIINDRGDTIAYEELQQDIPSISLFQRGDQPRKLCTGCSVPTSWFDGGRGFFYTTNSPPGVMLMNLPVGTGQVALARSGVSITDAAWCSRNQYLAFTASRDTRHKQIFAVAFPAATERASGAWIPITGAQEWCDRPQWSGDGQTLFYRSTRDEFSCIWKQTLDPGTHRPVGRPIAVRHFHAQRTSPARIVPWSFSIAVSGDTVFLPVAETLETIWTGKLMPPDPIADLFQMIRKF
jgi:Tol biopolymer transport system component